MFKLDLSKCNANDTEISKSHSPEKSPIEAANPKKEETTIDSKSECQQDVGSCTKKEKSNECSQPITIPSREIPSERTTLRAPEKTDEVQTAPLNNSSRRKAPPTINAKNIHIPKLALQNIQRQVSDL